jgi:serine/threonine protein kinase
MNTPKSPFNDTKTLAHRLSEGRLPVAEALHYAMQLAESLSRLHEAGKAHGAVTPANLALVAGGVELLPAAHESSRTITPYTAPEVVQGGAPDARSDIFSFGAILFEILTGRRAFKGKVRDIPASGNPALDRLVAPCLDSDPDARTARIGKVMMELKLLSVAARRTGTGMGVGGGSETANEAILARIDRGFEALNARMTQLENTVESMRRHASGLEYRVAADLVDIEQSIKVQSVAIESSRTAMSQTDDLVERVVEVLESLQATVLEQSEGAERSNFAVNY